MSGRERRLNALAATVERLRGELTAAQEAADARTLIGIATGILVERGHGGPTRAARHLEELAEAAGLPLVELAADVIDGAAGDTVALALSGAPRGSGGGHHSSPDVLRVRAAEAGSLTGDPQTVVDTLAEQVLAPLGASAWRCGPWCPAMRWPSPDTRGFRVARPSGGGSSRRACGCSPSAPWNG